MKKYGKQSEVANAHVQNIMSLTHINDSNPYKIHEFSEKLLNSVQALETMGKLKEINGYVKLTLDKLSGKDGRWLAGLEVSTVSWGFRELDM